MGVKLFSNFYVRKHIILTAKHIVPQKTVSSTFRDEFSLWARVSVGEEAEEGRSRIKQMRVIINV